MKKVLLIAALAVSSVSFAQTSKSTWMLGGGAGFTSTSSDGGGSVTNISVSPRIGYFIMDNLALGANVEIEKSGDLDATTNFGPFARYYFTSIGKNAKLFGDLHAGFINDGESQTTFGVAAGAAFFLNQSVALEAALGYDNNSTAKTSDIGLKVGFQIHFKK